MRDPWQVLGVPPSATYDEARRAYRVRSRLLHPDRHQGASEEILKETSQAFIELERAWASVKVGLSMRRDVSGGASVASPAATTALNDAMAKVADAERFIPTGFVAKMGEWIDGTKGPQLWRRARLAVDELIRFVLIGEISAVEALGWLGQSSSRSTLTHLGLTLDDLIAASTTGGQQLALLTDLKLPMKDKRQLLLGNADLDSAASAWIEGELVHELDPSDELLVTRLQESTSTAVQQAAWIGPGDAMAAQIKAMSRDRFPSVQDASAFLEQCLRFSQWIWDADKADALPQHVQSWYACLDAQEAYVMAANDTLHRFQRWERLKRYSSKCVIPTILALAVYLMIVTTSDAHDGTTGVASSVLRLGLVIVGVLMISIFVWLSSSMKVTWMSSD